MVMEWDCVILVGLYMREDAIEVKPLAVDQDVLDDIYVLATARDPGGWNVLYHLQHSQAGGEEVDDARKGRRDPIDVVEDKMDGHEAHQFTLLCASIFRPFHEGSHYFAASFLAFEDECGGADIRVFVLNI
jgi:hypothetical protein